MRKIIDTYQIYNFDELSDKAKKIAHMEFNSFNNIDYSFIIDYCIEQLLFLGFDIDEIYFTLCDSQGDGACFVGKYISKKIEFNNSINIELVEIIKCLNNIFEETTSISATIYHYGFYYNDTCWRISWHDDILSKQDSSIRKLIKQLMVWIYSQLEIEYRYNNSIEYFKIVCNNNEYEFRENGEMY